MNPDDPRRPVDPLTAASADADPGTSWTRSADRSIGAAGPSEPVVPWSPPAWAAGPAAEPVPARGLAADTTTMNDDPIDSPTPWTATALPTDGDRPRFEGWPSAGSSSSSGSGASGGPTASRRTADRRRTVGTVVAAALLSAVLASGSTVAIVSLIHPGSTTPITAAVANVTSTAGVTTVQADDITSVVATARDSVVTLTSQIGSPRGAFGGGTATGIGSGIILTADGYTLTNRHVVEGSQSLTATLADGTEYPATVVSVSSTKDLALVKIAATGLKPASIGDSSATRVGQTAIAIGSPLGTYTETVTKGIISALDRTITVQDDQTGRPVTLSGLIQTDAAINQGNSGGPLLDAAGEVVGINTATASSAAGIGFAIPIKEAASLIAQARAASVA